MLLDIICKLAFSQTDSVQENNLLIRAAELIEELAYPVKWNGIHFYATDSIDLVKQLELEESLLKRLYSEGFDFSNLKVKIQDKTKYSTVYISVPILQAYPWISEN